MYYNSIIDRGNNPDLHWESREADEDIEAKSADKKKVIEVIMLPNAMKKTCRLTACHTSLNLKTPSYYESVPGFLSSSEPGFF